MYFIGIRNISHNSYIQKNFIHEDSSYSIYFHVPVAGYSSLAGLPVGIDW